MKPTLLVLAAGMGSRYGGLKQIDALGPQGEALIEFSVYDAIRAGFGKVVFVIRRNIEDAFREKLGSKFDGKIEVVYAFQEYDSPIEGITEFPEREKPWGTAHAVLVAKDVVNEPFAVINADDYYGQDGFVQCADFLMNACTPEHQGMVGYVLKNTLSDHGTVNRGVCSMDDNMNLTTVHERLKISRDASGAVSYLDDDGSRVELSENSLVSMNFWAFHPSIFEVIRQGFVQFVKDNWENPKAEFFIPLYVEDQIRKGESKYKVLQSEDLWYGVTYQEDKPAVLAAFKNLIEKEVYPAGGLW